MTDRQFWLTSNTDTLTRQHQKVCRMNPKDEMQITRRGRVWILSSSTIIRGNHHVLLPLVCLHHMTRSGQVSGLTKSILSLFLVGVTQYWIMSKSEYVKVCPWLQGKLYGGPWGQSIHKRKSTNIHSFGKYTANLKMRQILRNILKVKTLLRVLHVLCDT